MSWILALYLSLIATLVPQTAPVQDDTTTEAAPPPPPTTPPWAVVNPGISNGI